MTLVACGGEGTGIVTRGAWQVGLDEHEGAVCEQGTGNTQERATKYVAGEVDTKIHAGITAD